MADNEQVREALEKHYISIWQDWYADIDDAIPAAIFFEEVSTWSIYQHNEHEHHINLGEWDVEQLLKDDEPLPPTSTDWPKWRQELVHEMLHEYQFRGLNRESTPEGEALHAVHRHKFAGQGHDADYFTAIAKWAPYFGLTPEDLIERVR